LIKNLKKYRTFADEDELSDNELIQSYLEMNKYHPVSFGEEGGRASNPEELKVRAMQDFVEYIRGLAGVLHKKAYLKNDISNNFIPKMPVIGFSDDDIRNVEVMKKYFKDKPIVKTYSTAGGIKKEYK
jgi:restriction endonuclease S subunit